jgi:hypothetical protein
MGFRFSIKWALAAIAYVALAAAALTQTGWAYASLLWFAAFAAFVYAVLLACYARGRRQARAVGFALGALSLAACVHIAPANVATDQLLRSVGVIKDQIVFGATASMPPAGVFTAPVGSPTPVFNAYGFNQGATGTLSITARPSGPTVVATTQADTELKVRAANAIAAVLAGLLGMLLASLAFAKSQPQPVAS